MKSSPRFLQVAIAAFILSLSGWAAAQEASVSARRAPGLDNTISVFGILGYWYSDTGLGVGARYQKTIVPMGFIHGSNVVHDDLGIEAGADFFHYSFNYVNDDWSYNEIAIVAGVVWNFWFLDGKLGVYPKVDVGFRFGSWSGPSGVADPGGYGGIIVVGSGGVVYKTGNIALRAEAGSGNLRLGVGFTF